MVIMVLAISLRPWCGMRWIGCHCLWRGVFLTFTEKKRRGQEESKREQGEQGEQGEQEQEEEEKEQEKKKQRRRRREEKRREEIKEKTKVRGNISSDETFDYFFPRLIRLW